MTSVIDVYVYCDHCKEASASGGEHPSSTVKEAREFARGNGWVNVGRKDFCPECVNEGKA